MEWTDFYDRFSEWAPSTVRSRISALQDMGPGIEIADAVLVLEDEGLRTQLIRKAMRLNAAFTADDFAAMEDALPEEVYRELARYGGFDAATPWLDEDTMDWDDFYGYYSDWDEATLARRIGKLQKFGPADEVSEVIGSLWDSGLEDPLYERAVAAGVRFTKAQMEEMGRDVFDIAGAISNPISDDQITRLSRNAQILCDQLEEMPLARKRRRKTYRRLGLLTLVGALFGRKKKDPNKCDGDCAHCPPHYGYRYGRWFYGHGHMSDCERGGNRGGGNP